MELAVKEAWKQLKYMYVGFVAYVLTGFLSILLGWLIKDLPGVKDTIRVISGFVKAVAQMEAVSGVSGVEPAPFQVALIYAALFFFVVSAWHVYVGLAIPSARASLIESIRNPENGSSPGRAKTFAIGMVQILSWFIFPVYFYTRGASGVTWQSGVMLSPSFFSISLIILLSAVSSLFLIVGLLNIYVCFSVRKSEEK